ncbi:GrpB domain, predicted nucleotidyltransferase, UPF0157 family [Gracilibacillus ureilyticus]|uniref:GrpB domain, predicted nucleotidyltransferase, UPF0157 family n=1 Tax=Gracilibacillus ureilyticus TaxID=531814 RepID=A0A1H9NC85_9BACI|nr:GrpB family protein [Gracilibacillus ureilyticus]SER33421.1 GrpB domain, predicted nucleotidyltransferase, UPF0157 family [Gracilibacillus ureilyticus]
MRVRLSDYSDKWKQMFAEESQRLSSIFGDEIISFEHIGSTAIPGMKAKPVIDMICTVRSIERVDTYNDQMIRLGYEAAFEHGIEGRRLFRKGGENRTHHIHFYQWDNPEIFRHLVFRSYLLAHPEEVKRYSQYKEKLAERYEYTSEYSPAKKAFVTEMEKKALDWWENR